MARPIKPLKLTRRTFALGTAASSLVAGVTIRNASAQDATPDGPHHALVGAWHASVTLGGGAPRPAMLVYGADGTVIAPQPPSMPGFPGMAPLIFVSPAAGAWIPDGPNGAHVTFALLASDEAGAVLGLFSFQSHLEVAADGLSYEQTYMATFTDPAGNAMPLGPGAATATRIVAEPMDMTQIATPVT